MADYVFKVTIPYSIVPSLLVDSAQPRESCMRIGRLFRRVGGGGAGGTASVVCDTGTSGAVAASGTLTISGGAGAVGGTIGGTLVTVAHTGNDTTSATALAAAIMADVTVNKYVSATSALGVVTVTAIQPGTIGNGITLVASGTGVTASGAKLANGAATRTTFSF
jgi:phage tail sheath gpL-like